MARHRQKLFHRHTAAPSHYRVLQLQKQLQSRWKRFPKHCTDSSTVSQLHGVAARMPTIERRSISDLTPQRLWDGFISTRKPVSKQHSTSDSAALSNQTEVGCAACCTGRH